jgi:hypothetical protein
MRCASALVLGLSLVLVTPRLSAAQGSVDGFGALSLNRFSSLDGSSLPLDFGGRVSVDLVPGVQAVGEFGRIGNVLPTVIDLPLSLLPFDVRASAFYGEGGVRFLGAPRSAVTPYLEATAGIARVNFHVGGLGPTADTFTRAALNLFDRTDPIAGAGAGVMFRGGPVLVDVGYRYKQIFADSLVGTLLSAGQGLRSHQVRFGLGVRF